MYRGAAYADSSQYLMCIHLWRYALQLRIQKDSLLYGDTCFTALALVRSNEKCIIFNAVLILNT